MLKKIAVTIFYYGIAQASLVLASPFLSRIYGPEVFGRFALILNLVTIALPLVALRYEYAIPLLKSRKMRLDFAALCLHLAVICSLVFAVIVVWGNVSGLGKTLVNFPVLLIMLYLQAAIQIVGLVLLARGLTKRVAQAKFFQNLVFVAVQLSLPFIFQAGSREMIIAYVVAQLASVAFLLYCLKEGFIFSRLYKLKALGLALRKHYRFPVFSSWSGFLDAFSTALPIFFITKYYGAHDTGVFFFVTRIFLAPTALIAKGVSQVLVKEVADRARQKSPLLRSFLKLSLALLSISILYFFFMQLVAYYAPEIFGGKWVSASQVISVFSYAVCAIFIASPLSIIFVLIEKNLIGSVWQVIYLAATALLFYLFNHASFIEMLKYLTMLWVGLYGLYWLMNFTVLFAREKTLCAE